MARVKTYRHATRTLAEELNIIQDEYEKYFQIYQSIHYGQEWISGSLAAATRVLHKNLGISPVVSPVPAWFTIHLDPASFTAGTRITKYRLFATAIRQAVASGATFTVGLYPISSWGGASGSNPTGTIGTVVAGSTVTFTSAELTDTNNVIEKSVEFTAPSAGWYVLGANNNVTTASGSNTFIWADLQMIRI